MLQARGSRYIHCVCYTRFVLTRPRQDHRCLTLLARGSSTRELDAEARVERVLVGKPFLQDAVRDRRSAFGAFVHAARTQVCPAPWAHPVPARNKGDGGAARFHAHGTLEPVGPRPRVLDCMVRCVRQL